MDILMPEMDGMQATDRICEAEDFGMMVPVGDSASARVDEDLKRMKGRWRQN